MNLYALAKNKIESTTCWPSGESVTIWASGSVKVNIEAGPTNSGRLDLVLYNGERHRVEAGHFSPMKGWKFNLTRADYAGWVERCGGQLDPERQEYDELRQLAQATDDIPALLKLGALINAHPITRAKIAAQHADDVELGELRRCDVGWLRDEWTEHHRQRGQERHPEQVRYNAFAFRSVE